MGLALGIICLWLGAACIWVAVHGTDAKTPWQAYQAVAKGIKGSLDPGDAGGTT